MGPVACTDKTWEFDVPVVCFNPDQHKYTLVETTLETQWKWTGWGGIMTATYLRVNFKTFLEIAPVPIKVQFFDEIPPLFKGWV